MNLCTECTAPPFGQTVVERRGGQVVLRVSPRNNPWFCWHINDEDATRLAQTILWVQDKRDEPPIGTVVVPTP